MAGRCEACGGTVMPYRRYMLWMKPTAECGSCGAHVRLRGFWPLVVASLLSFGVGGAAIGILSQGLATGWGWPALAALAAAALAADYASWVYMSWAPEGPADPTSEGTSEGGSESPPEA